MPGMLDDAAVLALWERAIGVPEAERGDALIAASGGGVPAGLGERNLSLIRLHGTLFGRELHLLSHCPACGAAVQFVGDSDALAAQCQSSALAATTLHRIEWGDHLIDFRVPLSRDVAEAAGAESAGESVSDAAEAFARRLLECCVVSCRHAEGTELAAARLPAEALDAISRRIEAIDPGASIVFDVDCPDCSERWSASLDVAVVVWRKLQRAAEAILLEIDALARAYGWSEREILGLGPLRRAAYLQMVAR